VKSGWVAGGLECTTTMAVLRHGGLGQQLINFCALISSVRGSYRRSRLLPAHSQIDPSAAADIFEQHITTADAQ